LNKDKFVNSDERDQGSGQILFGGMVEPLSPMCSPISENIFRKSVCALILTKWAIWNQGKWIYLTPNCLSISIK
jgi:hypothetical protein